MQTFKKWGLDILPHRAKMEKRELDKEFKDRKNPFRVVFVCAMWLTGFDVKCLSCMYLDKPLKAHTLMQTIARANRVSEGKSNGLIVDYIGIVKALRKALADYTVSKNSPAGIDPTVDKTELIQRIRTVIGETDGFLAEHGFRLQELVDAQDFEKMNLVQDAANAMCETLETKKTFQTYASELARLFRYADRDDVDDTVRARKNAILAIYEGLQQKRKHADNTDLMVQINGIVNEYIHVEKPDQEAVPSRQFDISKIDFELLSREFAHTRRKNLLLRDLDELVNQQLAKMLFANPQRIDYYDRYQEIIDAYNAEQNRATIEKTFMDLMELASSLDTEQQRYVREGFSSDEELSVYDLLFSENLTKQEIETIKKVSVDLLIKIKQQIAKLDHWTDKGQHRCQHTDDGNGRARFRNGIHQDHSAAQGSAHSGKHQHVEHPRLFCAKTVVQRQHDPVYQQDGSCARPQQKADRHRRKRFSHPEPDAAENFIQRRRDRRAKQTHEIFFCHLKFLAQRQGKAVLRPPAGVVVGKQVGGHHPQKNS